MVKIKSPICLSFKPPSALRQWTHISNMLPLACLDGDLKSGASVADLILTMGLRWGFHKNAARVITQLPRVNWLRFSVVSSRLPIVFFNDVSICPDHVF